MKQKYVFSIVCDLLEHVQATLTIDGEYFGTVVCPPKVLNVIADSMRRNYLDVDIQDKREGSEWSITPKVLHIKEKTA